MSGLYIHIPFCASRCIYCGFYSTTLLPLQDAYVEALCKEMKMQKPVDPVQTVYLGGGTPSLLSRGNLEKLFANIHAIYGRKTEESTVHHPESFREVTIECNPDDITDEFAREIVSLGINRVSIGAQTFSPARLRFIHRRHTAEQIPAAVHRLRNAGIHNISIDLMFGFPGETLQDYQKTLDLMEKVRFDTLFSFQYSERQGTAAVGLDGKVSAEEKRRRLIELQALQDRHTQEKNSALVGRTVEVLVEGTSRNTPRDVSGRTRSNKIVNFAGGRDLAGKTVRVRVVEAFLHSLRGEMQD